MEHKAEGSEGEQHLLEKKFRPKMMALLQEHLVMVLHLAMRQTLKMSQEMKDTVLLKISLRAMKMISKLMSSKENPE